VTSAFIIWQTWADVRHDRAQLIIHGIDFAIDGEVIGFECAVWTFPAGARYLLSTATRDKMQ
jgi:hypothetical protein